VWDRSDCRPPGYFERDFMVLRSLSKSISEKYALHSNKPLSKFLHKPLLIHSHLPFSLDAISITSEVEIVSLNNVRINQAPLHESCCSINTLVGPTAVRT
jgi:hypothetical protein